MMCIAYRLRVYLCMCVCVSVCLSAYLSTDRLCVCVCVCVCTLRQVSVRWYKRSGQLPDRATDDRRGLLVIRAVISSDSGVYVCEARDSNTTVTEETVLRVGGRCNGGTSWRRPLHPRMSLISL